MAASGPLHLQFPLSGKFFLRYSPRSFCPFTQVSLLTSPSEKPLLPTLTWLYSS